MALALVGLAWSPQRATAQFSEAAAIGGNAFTADTLNSPTAVGASVSGTSVTVTWTATSDTYATGHRVFRSATSGSGYTQIAQVTPRSTTSYVDAPGTGTWYYVVRAYYQNWESVNSNEATGVSTLITFRASASNGAPTGATSLVMNKPAGTAPSDVMVATVAARQKVVTVTAPSGWVLIRRIDNTDPVGPGFSHAVYYKVAGTSEPSTYTWSFSFAVDGSPTGLAGGIMSFSNVDTASPIDVENGQSTSLALTHATPSVITTTANAMVVTSHSFSSAATWTPPTGMTEAYDVASEAPPQNLAIALEGNWVLKTAAGATGTKTATASIDADPGNTHILALKPAP